MGVDAARPASYGDYSGAAVAMDCHRPARGGQVQISCGVRGVQVLRAPVQGAPVLLAPHVGKVASRATRGPEDAPPGTLRRPGATDPPHVLAPKTEPGIWFHDLPALATLRGTVVAVDAGTTPAGMAMAGVAERGHEAYQAQVASGVGTSQEGEAMVLLSYVRRLAM